MDDFSDQPASYFNHCAYDAQRMEPQSLARLQLAGLQRRFAAYRNVLPPLAALAEGQGISELQTLNDAALLLFPHSFYKSYPERILWEKDFPQLTRWLAHLTTNDLTAATDDELVTFDGWIANIEAKTNLWLTHSSGTTGNISFFPRGQREMLALDATARMCCLELFGDGRPDTPDPGPMPIIWPGFANGYTALLRSSSTFRRCIAQSADNFYPLHDYTMSSDVVLHIIRAEQLQRLGTGQAPVVTGYVGERMAEVDQLQANARAATEELLTRIEYELRGQRVHLAGGTHTVLALAEAGQARGLTGLFALDSIVNTFGGGKGQAFPPDWRGRITRFTGALRTVDSYAMTELFGAFNQCQQGRYHLQPWIIPFLLDGQTGRALPREGVQRGRAAYFDLTAQTFWGGILTGDEVELSYHSCDCGRTSAHLGTTIVRRAGPGSDDYYAGAASHAAIDAAREVLVAGLG